MPSITMSCYCLVTVYVLPGIFVPCVDANVTLICTNDIKMTADHVHPFMAKPLPTVLYHCCGWRKMTEYLRL